METICIGGEYFDPYYVLGVVKDDTIEDITKAFKLKAKKYHPDKVVESQRKKYERRFRIIMESYNYIRNKRTSHRDSNRSLDFSFLSYSDPNEFTGSDVSETNNNIKTEFDIASETSSKYDNPNDFGYGEIQRLGSIEEYEKYDDSQIINQFRDRKFSTDEFNKIFDYIKIKTEGQNEEANDKINEKTLIHKTTDGFWGYNTCDLGNCASVSTYSGLMITGDNWGESGVGYWDGNYSDYRLTYKNKYDPSKVVNVPKDFKVREPKILETKSKPISYSDALSDIAKSIGRKNIATTFGDESAKMYKRNLDCLIEKKEADKEMILKYAHQYDKNTVKHAIDGTLDKSPELIDILNQHYNAKRIT